MDRLKALPLQESPEEKTIRELQEEVAELRKEKTIATKFLDSVAQGLSPEEAQQQARRAYPHCTLDLSPMPMLMPEPSPSHSPYPDPSPDSNLALALALALTDP